MCAKNAMKKKEATQLAVIFCPPLSKYPEKPNDISKSELVPCPHCEGEMWFSVKKKEMMLLAKEKGMDVYFGCHDCFKQDVELGLFDGNFKRVEIYEQ